MNTKEENDICSRLQTYIMNLIDQELKKRKCSVNKFCEYSGIQRINYYAVKRLANSIGLTFIVRASECLSIPLSDFFKLPEWETKEHSYTRVDILVPKDCSIIDFFKIVNEYKPNNEIKDLVQVNDDEISNLVNQYIDIFANKLELYLKKYNITLSCFVESCNISMPHYYRFINKQYIPTLKTLSRIFEKVPFFPPILFSQNDSNINNVPKGYINVCKLVPTNIESLIEMFYD